MYEKMDSIEDVIKLYAVIMAEDGTGDKRCDIHAQLCKLLGVSKDDFKPFDWWQPVGMGHLHVKQAEGIIRRDLRTEGLYPKGGS